MKKLAILFCIGMCSLLSVNAQELRVIKETFDSNKLRWDEFFEKKKYSGSIVDGYYVLENQQDSIVKSVVELPINVETNFKITFKFLIPKFNDKYMFGIVYNYQDEDTYRSFEMKENLLFQYVYFEGHVKRIRKPIPIILKEGKNKEVLVVLEKKGKNTILSIDGMEFYTTSNIIFQTNTFGFLLDGESILKVDEVTIEQIVRDDE